MCFPLSYPSRPVVNPHGLWCTVFSSVPPCVGPLNPWTPTPPPVFNTDNVCGAHRHGCKTKNSAAEYFFGDILACTVFVSSIFVYLIDILKKIKREKKKEGVLLFSLFCLFCFIHLKKKCCMWLTWTVNKNYHIFWGNKSKLLHCDSCFVPARDLQERIFY